MSAHGHTLPLAKKKCTCAFDQPENGFAYVTHCGCEQCDFANDCPISKKASKPVSDISKIVNARELEITEATTVNDLYEMIDLPYRFTKHAKVSIKENYSPREFVSSRVLRVEWSGANE